MKELLLQRIFHRQMYIDLTRAYLLDYGKQRDLARALTVSAPELNHFLRPLIVPGNRSHWADAARLEPSVLRRELGVARTPPPAYAADLAARLCTDAERRDRLLYHVEMARRRASPATSNGLPMPHEEMKERLREIGDVHEIALYDSDSQCSGAAYAAVWEECLALLPLANAREQILQHAQLLMFLNNAASVLNQADLALAYAREAELMLAEAGAELRDPVADRMRMNALLAEMVTLNNLRLFKKAIDVKEYAEGLPGYGQEARAWKRSFLEQHLKALAGQPRFHIGEAEYVAEHAGAAAEHDPELTIGIDAHLAGAYLAHGSRLNLRRARLLVDELRSRMTKHPVAPLRQLRVLRTAMGVYGAEGDEVERVEVLRAALRVIDLGGFEHQGVELKRLYRS